jgi:hypothetical protein
MLIMHPIFLFAILSASHAVCPPEDVACSIETDDSLLLSRRTDTSLLTKLSHAADQKRATALVSDLQSLAERVVRGEEKITPATERVLDGISEEMDNIMAYTTTQHGEDQGEVNAATQAIANCGSAASSGLDDVAAKDQTMSNGKQTHNQCRIREKAAYGDEVTKCNSLTDFVTNLAPPACMSDNGNWQQFAKVSYKEMQDCFSEIEQWARDNQELHASKETACQDAIKAHDDEHSDCDKNQDSYEAAACSWADNLIKNCDTQVSCRNATITARDTTQAAVRSADGARQAEYKAAVKIKCLLRVLHAPDAQKGSLLADCSGDTLNTTVPFTMQYPETPAIVPCVSQPADSRPCTSDWLASSYESQGWYDFQVENRHSMSWDQDYLTSKKKYSFSSSTEKVVPKSCTTCPWSVELATTEAPTVAAAPASACTPFANVAVRDNSNRAFWQAKCNDIPSTASFVRVTMGTAEDYYKPIEGVDLCEMLTHGSKHLHSYDKITWTDGGYHNDRYLGGSTSGFPRNNPDDKRDYTAFWGFDDNNGHSGCCSTDLAKTVSAWHQAFSMDICS